MGNIKNNSFQKVHNFPRHTYGISKPSGLQVFFQIPSINGPLNWWFWSVDASNEDIFRIKVHKKPTGLTLEFLLSGDRFYKILATVLATIFSFLGGSIGHQHSKDVTNNQKSSPTSLLIVWRVEMHSSSYHGDTMEWFWDANSTHKV